MKNILVVVDMQTDFTTGALGCPAAEAIIPSVASRIERAHAEDEQVIFTLDTHPEHYLDTAEGRALPVVHCIKGTEGHRLNPAILKLVEPRDIVIEKPTFGSWEMADIVAGLSDDPEGRDLHIEICGLYTDICVVANTLLLKTRLPEAQIKLLPDLCAGVTESNHQATLQVLASCQIEGCQ